uniref:RING-type domain-containing protein n=1 Tax=viral metagenome TaxID=1070528 RepID=A0A6C0IHF6_9ZZZZ
MTSLKYNTFSEETINQCIICLNNSVVCNNDEVTLMNNMHFLQKQCECVCYAHHKCIETWINTNSVCPICRKPISFPQTNLSEHNKDQIIVNISPIEPLLENEIDTESHKKCRDTMKVYIIGLVLLSIFICFSNVYIL